MAFVGPAVDLQAQNGLRPAVPQRLLGIPQSRLLVVEAFEQGDVLAPGQLCNGPLHNLAVGPCGGEGAHVLQISRRKPLHVGGGCPQVCGEAIDDLGPPAGAFLAVQDHPADVPVQQNHRRVGSQDDAKPFLLDASLDLPEHLRVAARHFRTRRRHGERGPARMRAPARNAGSRPRAGFRHRLCRFLQRPGRLLPTRHTQAPSGWRRWWRPASWLPPAARAA